jgi:hypothetical protein
LQKCGDVVLAEKIDLPKKEILVLKLKEETATFLLRKCSTPTIAEEQMRKDYKKRVDEI